jgi:predicted alpha/beta hydrolase family esterase
VESDGVYGAHENSSDVCGDHVEAVHVKIKRMKSALIFVSHSRACSVVLSCCIE